MRVPVELFLDRQLLPGETELSKLVRIASTPGLVGQIDVLPDVHFKAKNFMPTGVALRLYQSISPTFLGPANDALTLARTGLKTQLFTDDVLDLVYESLKRRVAVFRRSEPTIDESELWEILSTGTSSERFGFSPVDLARMENGESSGAENLDETQIRAAFPACSKRPPHLASFVPWHDVVTAGRHCLGVLDGGGHFLELCVVEDVVDEEIAKTLAIEEGDVLVALHAGPADVGLIAHKHHLPDRQSDIRVMDVESEEGGSFLTASRAASNFATANRLHILGQTRDAIQSVCGQDAKFEIFSDAPHDMLDPIPRDNGTEFVHRKGVVRTIPADAFPDSHQFSQTGRPFFFPTSLGQDAFIMTRRDGDRTQFQSCSHGVGRRITRDEALATYDDASIVDSINSTQVRLYRYGHPGFSAQAPAAHKDAESVLGLLQRFELSQIVARLRPLASLKP